MKIAVGFFLALSAVVVSCSTRETSISSAIPYPAAPAKDSIELFLPGIVSRGNDSIDFNAAFSPDGKSFYYTRSLNRKWDIYVSHYRNGAWAKALKTSFSTTEYSEADPAFGPDGALYYISDMPKADGDTLRDFDIWRIRPQGDSLWSAPENVAIVNTDSTEYYISFAGDGNLYFASSRVGGYGMEDIYISRLVGGKYLAPENLGPSINSSFSDHDPCLPKNERFMIFTSVERPDGYGEGDLYASIKGADGAWSTARHLGKQFNTKTYEYCSYFSPDYRYFFFSGERNVKWMRTESLPQDLLEVMNNK